jgi:hypothetical protein
MAIPAHADPRSHKHFSRGFVGSKHGEDGTGHRISWDSTSGAQSTSAIQTGRFNHTCIYCGHNMYPIQRDIGMDVSGFACVCKDAMDELEWREQYTQLLAKQKQDRQLLAAAAPKANPEVMNKMARQAADQLFTSLTTGKPGSKSLDDALEKFDMRIGTPLSYFTF